MPASGKSYILLYILTDMVVNDFVVDFILFLDFLVYEVDSYFHVFLSEYWRVYVENLDVRCAKTSVFC